MRDPHEWMESQAGGSPTSAVWLEVEFFYVQSLQKLPLVLEQERVFFRVLDLQGFQPHCCDFHQPQFIFISTLVCSTNVKNEPTRTKKRIPTFSPPKMPGHTFPFTCFHLELWKKKSRTEVMRVQGGAKVRVRVGPTIDSLVTSFHLLKGCCLPLVSTLFY